MKKLLLALTLSLSAAACGDVPTQPATPSAPATVLTNTSTAFGVDLILEKAADEYSNNWYFLATLKNPTAGHPSNYYFTWTDPIGNVLLEGWGLHTYTHVAYRTAEVNLVVWVNGPDGEAMDYIDVGPTPIPPPFGGGDCDLGWKENCRGYFGKSPGDTN